jgi:hypothetical protein
MKPYHIVFTTIHEPLVLWSLLENFTQYGHLDDVKCWVVGDFKTPPICQEIALQVSEKGLETCYLGIEEQDIWGKRFPEFYKCLPYNNETRRNIGYLHALENGAKVLISIDDDNFPTDQDFIGGHLHIGTNIETEVVFEETGFHNICEYLSFEPSRHIYPRGFPFNLRGSKNSPTLKRVNPGSIVGVNEGLWFLDPDIDATTWLNGAISAKKYLGPDHIILDHNVWSPINTQNTSVIRDLVPAFLCIPMGFPVPGGKIERYGDIWGGYFLQSVMRDSRYYVSFGKPIVEHRRNQHNFVDDLRHEFWGMMLTDWLLAELMAKFTPSDDTISGRMLELSEFLIRLGNNDLPTWAPIEMKEFIVSTTKTIKAWIRVCQDLL